MKEQIIDLEKEIRRVKTVPVKEKFDVQDSVVGGLTFMPNILDINVEFKYDNRKYVLPLGTPIAMIDVESKRVRKSSRVLDCLRSLQSFLGELDKIAFMKHSPVIPIFFMGETENMGLENTASRLGFARINLLFGERVDDFSTMLGPVSLVRANLKKLMEESTKRSSIISKLEQRELRGNARRVF